MSIRAISIALATAAALVVLSGCGTDSTDGGTNQSPSPTSSAQLTPPIDVTNTVDRRRYYTVETIARIVTERGGDETQVLGTLAAAEAESGWYAGNRGGSSVNRFTVDVFGWPASVKSGGAEGVAATEEAVERFMDNAATLPPETHGDPVRWAVDVQFADTRGYDLTNRVFSKPETSREDVAAKYQDSMLEAEAALQQLEQVGPLLHK